MRNNYVMCFGKGLIQSIKAKSNKAHLTVSLFSLTIKEIEEYLKQFINQSDLN